MLRSLIRELRGLDSSRRSLRNFGLLMGAIVASVGLWMVWRSSASGLSPLDWGANRTAAYVLTVGLGLAVVGLIAPRVLKPLYLAWMALALVLGAVTSRIVLTAVFVLMIIPIGMVLKAIGKDPLDREIDSQRGSYWIIRDEMDRDPERLEKYF